MCCWYIYIWSISKNFTFDVHIITFPQQKKKKKQILNWTWCFGDVHFLLGWKVKMLLVWICFFSSFYAVGHDWSEAIYMQYAIEDGWGMQYNLVESCWFYQKSIWSRPCWDIVSSGSCKLPAEKDLFLWPPLLPRRTPTRIQTVSPNAGTIANHLLK